MMTLTLVAVMGMGAQASKEPLPARYANLAVYPIFEPLSSARAEDYISLDEGLKAGTVVVTEKGAGTPRPLVRPRNGQSVRNQNFRGGLQQRAGNGAEVNTLWIINKSGKKLLMLAGEMVVGGQQDRILQKDGIIPPTKEAVNLDVFCVEHGRWTATADNFSAPKSAAVGGAGAFAGGIADPRLRGVAQHGRNQEAVWSEVDSSLKRNSTVNGTTTYRGNLESQKVQGNVENYVSAIKRQFPEGRAMGAVVAVNGRLIWMDRFGSNATFRKYWPKLLRSYALEAMGHPTSKSNESVPSYIQALGYAADKSGKTTFEGQEGVWKLVRTESGTDVRYEIQDTDYGKAIPLHASRMRKG